MAKKSSNIKRDILHRVYVLYGLFFILGMAIILRILYIQYGPSGEMLRQRAEQISLSWMAVEASRGDILARDGRILATSIPMYEIRMDFGAAGLSDSVFRKNVDSLALCLSGHFRDRSTDAYRRFLNDNRASRGRYVLISPRRINYLELKKLSQFPLFRLGGNRGGFISVQVDRRVMPNGTLAARTIGGTTQDGVKWGIEGGFDNQLRGKDGNMLMQRVSGSFWVPVSDVMNIEPTDGVDVVSTIDVDIQDVAEDALRRQLVNQNALWGTVVLMEVATGEIRAIANLTRRSAGVYAEDYNYAIGRAQDPGSTFKLASLLALLEDAKFPLTKTYDTEGGRAYVRGRYISDDHAEGVLTLKQVFEKSSNIGFAKAVDEAYSSNPNRFINFLSTLGLTEPFDLQIGGGARPVINRPGEKGWDGLTLTQMAFGYALTITPLHTLALYNAVANGGKMVRPKFVSALSSYGEVSTTYGTEVMNSLICSPSTLKMIRESLQGVVDEGTAQMLRNSYYTVAAKTGTAQVRQETGGYADAYGGRNYLATMVGYFPAADPKYSCIVSIETYFGRGSYGAYYGASLAGPVFKAVADRVNAAEWGWQPAVAKAAGAKSEAPVSLKGGRVQDIRNVANSFSVALNGDLRRDQWATLKRDSTGLTMVAADTEGDVIPNVVGMGLREAVYLMESCGLNVNFSGRGKVVSQNLRAGDPPTRGATVTLYLDL